MSNRVRPTRKLRRTFTLSPQNVAYIEKQARERNMPSLSAFLDELLQEKTREQKRAEIEANTIAYYDSLTDEEVEEQRAWGEFAGQTLVLTEEELAHAQSAARRDLVHKGCQPTLRTKESARSPSSRSTGETITRGLTPYSWCRSAPPCIRAKASIILSSNLDKPDCGSGP
jgi:NAD dependent epimerase/dehydratase family enzyme